MTRQEFWSRLKVIAEGLSSRQVAKLLDASPSSCARWLKGTGAPVRTGRKFILDQLEALRKANPDLKRRSRAPEREIVTIPIEGEIR